MPKESLVILIILAIIFFAIPGIIIGITVPISVYKNRRIDFVKEHSVALKAIKKLNSQYKFYVVSPITLSHRYDNKDFFEDVTPTDYLVYDIAESVEKYKTEIKKAEYNDQQFKKYADKIRAYHYGEFDVDSSRYKKEKLVKIEKSIIKPIIKCPATTFWTSVKLTRTDLKGQWFESKRGSFTMQEVKSLITAVSQKRGTYYLNQAVWKSIEKVERSLVSNKLRFAIFNRDGNRCCKCGSRDNLEIDHIIPISKGGKSVPNNLQTLCHDCNYQKGNSLY